MFKVQRNEFYVVIFIKKSHEIMIVCLLHLRKIDSGNNKVKSGQGLVLRVVAQ